MRRIRLAFTACLLAVTSTVQAQGLPPIAELLGLPPDARPSILAPAGDRAPQPPLLTALYPELAADPAVVETQAQAPATKAEPLPVQAAPQRFVVEHVHTFKGPLPTASPSAQSAAVQVQPTPQAAAVVVPSATALTTTATVIHAGPLRRGIGNLGRWLATADQDVIRMRVPRTVTTTTMPVTQALVTVTTAVPAPAPAPVAAVQVPLPTPAAPSK